MAPLNPDEYAPGRMFTHESNDYLIRDTLQTGNGGRYLVIERLGAGPFLTLMQEGELRDNTNDEYEAVDPDDARERREQALNPPDDAPDAPPTQDTPQDQTAQESPGEPTVTGGTGGTDVGEASPATPGTPPAEQAPTTGGTP